MRKFSIYLLKFYQIFISPIMRQVFGANCRFSVSCSEYAIQNIWEHGILIGGVKSAKRILSCSPISQKHEYI